MILQIRLLSDLCASSGDIYNSYVDTDVVYEDCGLPFIPAKRIKGCIREAALELTEWGVFEKKLYESLFGKEGKDDALFTLDNAYLQDYDKLVADLVNCEDKVLAHPQKVLGLYTYTRTQTAMTKDGVADKGSLRTMRVMNKGLVFEANLKANPGLTEEQQELLEKAVSMVKHMGTGRTRGLGLVELSLQDEDKKEARKIASFALKDWNKINYTITLKSPLLCKSATGSQEKTHDYIEGSKVLGILAQNLPAETFAKLMRYDGQGQGILVSNAYICYGQERCTPISASLQKRKDQPYDENGKLQVVDMLLPCAEDAQWTPVGSGYVSPQGWVKPVEIEVNYHHRRPDNKALGKATGEDASAFYQLESLRKGQTFAGYILADREQAEVIVELLQKVDGVRMGYGRNAEYGNVEVTLTDVEPLQNKQPQLTKNFVIKLNSPAILYNESGVPSADVECLKGYLAEVLQVEENALHINSAFLTYETIGGFNVTWRQRKPIFTALGKGTVCYFTADREVDISLLSENFIGERVAEGYGELEILAEPQSEVILMKTAAQKAPADNTEQTDILENLRRLRNREALARAGVAGANELLQKEKSMFASKDFKATLSKITIIVRNEKTVKAIEEQIEGIESDTKKKNCRKLIDKAKADVKEIPSRFGEDEATAIYLYSFLNQIKYVTYRKEESANE